MPPKRKSKFSPKKKQIQTIRTRLIEISLKVEDLIYYKKPISVVEADLYMKEVTSYQLECTQDERSMQVIEKLIRCMKAIISEHQEKNLVDTNRRDDNCYLDNGSLSPVYSLPDEDRTQLSQELGEQTANLKPNEKLNELDNFPPTFKQTELTPIKVIHDVTINDNAVTKIINEVSLTAITDCTENDTTTKVEMHKAFSNLSLNNDVQDNVMCNDIECSQSILVNFNELNTLEQNDTRNVKHTYRKHFNDVSNTNENIQNKTQNPIISLSTNVNDCSRKTSAGFVEQNTRYLDIAEDVNKNYTLSKQTMPDNFMRATYSVKPTNYVNLSSVQNVAKNNLNSNNNNILEKSVIDSTPVIFNILKNKNINVTSNSVERYTDILTIKRKDQENITVLPSTIKKKRNPGNKKTTENKGQKVRKTSKKLLDASKNTENKMIDPPKRTNTKKKVNNKREVKKQYSAVPIYNKNAENDLSWLESIRFVREVSEAEFDRKLMNINEDFWDNYYLPPNFDEGDFL